jgi:fructose/tagatose bisphosphate aldolase
LVSAGRLERSATVRSGAAHLDQLVPEAAIQSAIQAGISKININAELRSAYLQATADGLEPLLSGSRLSDLHAAQTATVERIVARKLAAFTVVA